MQRNNASPPDGDHGEAEILSGRLQRAAGDFKKHGVAESLRQEVWELVRRLTPFLSPGGQSDQAVLRWALADIDLRLSDVRRRAGVPESWAYRPRMVALSSEFEQLRARILRVVRQDDEWDSARRAELSSAFQDLARAEAALEEARREATDRGFPMLDLTKSP
ncbi:MAG TPA: hypothetical protein VK689_07370 [Armatimonadota bacterium]|nr:hypothetical protein [Armatimonadota bacterium]